MLFTLFILSFANIYLQRPFLITWKQSSDRILATLAFKGPLSHRAAPYTLFWNSHKALKPYFEQRCDLF